MNKKKMIQKKKSFASEGIPPLPSNSYQMNTSSPNFFDKSTSNKTVFLSPSLSPIVPSEISDADTNECSIDMQSDTSQISSSLLRPNYHRQMSINENSEIYRMVSEIKELRGGVDSSNDEYFSSCIDDNSDDISHSSDDT